MSAGKKGKKNKGKSLSLGEFLGTSTPSNGSTVIVSTKSSWADDTEEYDEDRPSSYERIVLPTAPRQSMGTCIDHSRLPENPPFLAYVGNLPFDVEDEDIELFFKDLKVLTIRLPSPEGRFKGYGYIEFETKADLIEALSFNEETLKGRKIKVDIADEERSSGRRGDGGNQRRDDDREDRSGGVSDWRATPREDQDRSPGRNKPDDRGDRERDDNRDRNRGYSDNDRGYNRDRGYNNRDRGGYGDRDRGFGDRDRGFGDRDRDRGSYNDRDRGYNDRYRGYNNRDRGYGDRDRGYGDRDDNRGYRDRNSDRYDRGNRYGGGGGGGRYEDRRGGGGGGGSYRRDEGRESEPPKERPVLNLKPRTKTDDAPEEKKSADVVNNSAIFGGAKPVDTLQRELEIEKKLSETKEPPKKEPPPTVTGKDIFGSARPVDTATREREIEEKLKKTAPNKGEEEVSKRPALKSEKRDQPRQRNDRGEFGKNRDRAEEDNRNQKNTNLNESNTRKSEPKKKTEKEDDPQPKKAIKSKKMKDEEVIINTTNKFSDLGLDEEEA